MANLMDYMDWRGDLDFSQSPFNEVDNLILAQLVYVEFEGIVPKPGEEGSITVAEASEKFFETHDEKEILARVSMTKTAAFVLKKMAQTKRFQNVRLFGYLNDISLEEQSQFSVVCVALSEESVYVSFSGTDNTIVGWRENFNMGYLSETPGQLKAVSYLNHMMKEKFQTILVGGHSKGGNLSVYASVKCEESIQRRIVCVYSNDGPGFSEKMIQSEEYQRMLPKIRTILPESSIVGMLLEHQEKFEVVKSSQSGIGQHDAMSWCVMGAEFEKEKMLSIKSRRLNKALSSWIENLTYEQRAEFVDTLFALVSASGAKNLSQISTARFRSMNAVIKSFRALDKSERTMIMKILASLTGEIGRAYKNGE